MTKLNTSNNTCLVMLLKTGVSYQEVILSKILFYNPNLKELCAECAAQNYNYDESILTELQRQLKKSVFELQILALKYGIQSGLLSITDSEVFDWLSLYFTTLAYESNTHEMDLPDFVEPDQKWPMIELLDESSVVVEKINVIEALFFLKSHINMELIKARTPYINVHRETLNSFSQINAQLIKILCP